MSPTNRVTAPIIEPGSKVKGPASYFLSIETTYGRSLQEDENDLMSISDDDTGDPSATVSSIVEPAVHCAARVT